MKDKANKFDPKMVPIGMLDSIYEVRKFGCAKYSDRPSNSFYDVPYEDHIDAAFRHLKTLYKHGDYLTTDSESGLLHLEHALTDLAGAIEILLRAKTIQRGLN